MLWVHYDYRSLSVVEYCIFSLCLSRCVWFERLYCIATLLLIRSGLYVSYIQFLVKQSTDFVVFKFRLQLETDFKVILIVMFVNWHRARCWLVLGVSYFIVIISLLSSSSHSSCVQLFITTAYCIIFVVENIVEIELGFSSCLHWLAIKKYL